MKKFKLKDLIMKYPIIQGGMGVGISLGGLAGSVAAEGCMGVLSAANIGYKDKNFLKEPKVCNEKYMKIEIDKAREISKGNGIIGINIMNVMTDYTEIIKSSIRHGIDAIISGAGLPLSLATLVKNTNVLIAPIVSSKKAAELIIKTWLKKEDRLPDFIVIEGRDAGGHLGFRAGDLEDDKKDLKTILSETVEMVATYEQKYDTEIPIFVGGSVENGYQMKEYLDLGAFGVQLGTVFIATEECDAHINFKNKIVDSKTENIKIIESPVGLLGRAIKTKLTETVEKVGRIKPKFCIDCITTCDPNTTKYCITNALINAVNGDIEDGLIFCGGNVESVSSIITVKEVISKFMRECGII